MLYHLTNPQQLTGCVFAFFQIKSFLICWKHPKTGGSRENRTHLVTKVASPSRAPALPPYYKCRYGFLPYLNLTSTACAVHCAIRTCKDLCGDPVHSHYTMTKLGVPCKNRTCFYDFSDRR